MNAELKNTNLVKLNDFFQVLLGFIAAGDIFKGNFVLSLPYSRARLLPKLNAWLPCPWALRSIKYKRPAIRITGNIEVARLTHVELPEVCGL